VIFVMLDCSSPVKYAWGLIYAQMAVTYGGLIAFSWPALISVGVVPLGIALWLGMGDWGMIALTLFGALMFVVTSNGTARSREVKRQKERFQSAYLVTDRVAGESLDLALASTIAELGHFLHEMRNTLTTLRPNLRFLQQEELSDDGNEALEAAMQSGDKSTEIVERLMKTIKQRTGVGKGRFVLHEVLSENRIQNLTPSKGIRVDLQGDVPDFEVAGNPEHLEAALHNLVANAVQAGAKSIGISGTYDGGLRRAIIRIKDDGPGIPEESRNDIFDPTRASAKGTGHGLGLPISKRLVELLGGDLTLDASGPDGTTFKVRLAGKHKTPSMPPGN
jgi:signal transduction histidine kinase